MSLNKLSQAFIPSSERLIHFTKSPVKKIIGIEKIFIKILGDEIKLTLFLLNDETMQDIWLNKKGVRVNGK